VQNGISGYLCNVGDVDDMVKKAIHILDEKNLSKFKEGALARAKEFDIYAILPMYEAVYERVQKKTLKTVS